MEREHWTLLILDSAEGLGLSPLQLQKSLFLIGRNLPTEVGESFYKFVPYNYGPFDSSIYSDAHKLVDENLVRMISVEGRNWVYYAITPEGHQVAEQLRATSKLSDRASQYVEKVVKWVQSLSFAQLLSAIYQAFPEYKAKSVFVA